MPQSKTSTPLNRCKAILEKFLRTSPDIILCSKNYRGGVDDEVLRYLLEEGHEEFLAADASNGPQIGGLSEGALCDFVRSGRVFDGKHGRFRLQERYGPMSVRYFEAHPASS